MNASLTRIEHDIDETRGRLYDTIDRIQDRLTLPGILDEVIGSRAMPRFEGAFEQALRIVRRNPVPVLLMAAGIGWLIHRMGRNRAASRLMLIQASEPEVPVPGRIYDSDLPTARPQPA